MYVQFNDAARMAVRLAEHEAMRCGHECVDTRHLLIALFLLRNSVASQVLARGKISEVYARSKLRMLGPPDPGPEPLRQLRPSFELRRTFDLAIAAAERLGHPRVGTGHLLLGLLEEAGVACGVLIDAGIGRLGNNLSAVARHVCEEMSGPEECDEEEEESVFDHHDSSRGSPGSPSPPMGDRPAPSHPALPPDADDRVIAVLSTWLIGVAMLGLQSPLEEFPACSRVVDLALLSLGLAGVLLGGPRAWAAR